jgi:hypothetical protein
MLNKKILVILFSALHLVISLKSSDYCFLKQKECKGYYDENKIYKKKCNLINCQNRLNYECESRYFTQKLCTKTKIVCDEYIKLNKYMKMINLIQIEPKFFVQNLNEKKKIESFIKQIKVCQNKVLNLDQLNCV